MRIVDCCDGLRPVKHAQVGRTWCLMCGRPFGPLPAWVQRLYNRIDRKRGAR